MGSRFRTDLATSSAASDGTNPVICINKASHVRGEVCAFSWISCYVKRMTNLDFFNPRMRHSLMLLACFIVLGCKDPGGQKGCGVELESALLASPLSNESKANAHLVTHLRIFNDAPIDVEVKSLLWMLEVDGQALMRGKTPQTRQLAKESSQHLELRIPLSSAASRWIANAMNKPHRQVRLMGFCQIIAAGQSREVPFDAKQDVH